MNLHRQLKISKFRASTSLYIQCMEKKYIGLEALSRGIFNGKLLNANRLFSLPADENETLELNKKCIKAALLNLCSHKDSDNYTVFLNIGLFSYG